MVNLADRNLIGAWAVHLLTASGILTAGLALIAISQGDGRAALAWLLAALVIDGIDGPLARKLRVSSVLPSIDGETLDLVVDYVTYVFVPVAFIYQFELLSATLLYPLCAGILLSSLYLFSNRNMKSQDLYFVGFPAIWNLVVLYLHVLNTGPRFNAALILVLTVLTFVPIKSVHPLRVEAYRSLTVIMSFVWLGLTIAVLWIYPERNSPLEWVWTLAAAYFVLISGVRTFWGPLKPS
jgi:phosphatidylcholine synthase